ncbi:proline-rich protein 12-like isoform X1 [Mastacembelus armatus]|uniref:Proline rich 12a n=1 Tax=Mastacembelus armatus TaxID=205130 RepID=A0A3Q3M9N9_9TELE|nr:proline-rich protein 12-like isoform X1 [Mastacembelus armatus]
MDRNYPGTGFGDLGAGAGWSYERSAKASLVYGSSRSSHPESELLHRQAYATPHPLQGYATNHHPGSSGQGGAWGAAGRSLGLSGLFDTGLHHASPSAPDASVMNLISALESRGPQPPPSASSLLSQFRTPSWQTAMHTPAPPELFISGALPGSGSFPSSSALSAYQHPASFSSRSFPAASLSLQDTPTFSPTSNGLLSPHDPLLHIKAPSQSSLGFDRLLSSQGAAAAAYRGSQDPTGATSAQASSARHLQSHQFNLLSSQLQDQSSQLYNASVFSSAQPQPQSQSQSNSAQERAVPRQDSVIKHYQRPTPAQSQLSSSAAHSLQHYLSCGGAGYQQIATHHRHAGLSCSPLGDQSPSSDHKASSRTDQYRPIIQPPYSSSSSSSSSSSAGKGTKSSSSSGYSSASSASSSRTPHTPPSASSTSSSSSSSSATSGAHPSNSIPTSSSSAAPSRQQPPPQPAPPPPAPQQQPQPPATSTSAPQSLPKSCLSGYGSPVPPVKTPTSALTGQTPPQQQAQSYSPNQPPTSHLAQSYGGFSSPQAQDLSSGTAGKGYGSLGGRSQSYSTDIYGADSAYGSLPSSLGGAGSPSLGYGAPGHSPALLRSSGSSGSGASGGGSSSGTGSGNSGSGGGAGNSMTNERGGGGSGAGSYHLPDSSPSPSGNSGIIRPGLHSPVPTCPTQSPGGAGSNKYISSVLSPTFLASPQGYPDTRGPSSQPQSYHSASSKTKTDASMLGVGSQRSQEEVDDDDEFLIQHLLQAQASPAPQTAHHHPQQQPQQASQQTQPQPQSVPPTTDSGKGLSYDMGKTSEERYHPQSVIRTHSATSTAGVGNAGAGGSISGLDNQLEMSLKKQHQQHHHQPQQQQQRNERSVGSSRSSGGRGNAEQVHSHLHHHDNLGSVVHYGRGDPYNQHPLAPPHSSHTQHVSSHTQIPSHTQMELQKKPQERAEIPYPRKTPELQQQHSQSQAAPSLMDSPTDQSRQPPHLLQSVLSHTTRNKLEPHQQHHKMDSHQQHQQQHHKMESHRQHQQHHKMDSHQPHQQHPKMDSHPQHQHHQKMDSHQHQQHHKIDSHSHQQHHKMDSHAQQQQHSISQQQAVMESAGGRLGTNKHQAQSQSQTTQLQLQLQSQALEVAAAHYNHGPPPHQHEQSQVKQSSVVSSLDMLERSLSQTSSTDVAVAEDRRGGAGSGGRSGGSSERHRQQQQEQQQRQHPPHHQPQQTHHSQQHSASELHSFLSEPDIGLSTPSHMHHLSQHHPQQQQHPSSQHQQTHSHHPHTQPHPQQQPPHPHHIPPPASAHSQPQPDPQQPLSSQLTPQQSQLDQQRSEQHQFDTVSPVEKADQNQQSNRFVPLTSICFPDSLLQDEDRSFFPGMEDMFCAEDYKSSCAGGAGPGQEEMNESHTGPEGMDSIKAGQSAGGAGGSGGASYDIMGHHGGDQGYEPYCHGLEEPSNNTMTLDLDSLKTHELPSTVNTEQLGLIQSQAPAMGMGSNTAGPTNSGAKMSSGPGGTSTATGSGGLQSPIFCSSRPKKLLKSSSFHLLKERRDPNTMPKKSYAQEYEFEDDEDKADQPADIRLNSRRLPDLLPDLVSSCRKGGGSGSLSPLMGDIDFYHSSGYPSMGTHSLIPQDGPKKRGRKPTRPKREGPPRPRGRPRIRPMPEPYTPRGMMGEMGGSAVGGGFSVEGRGRGRGRGSRGRGGRREDMYMEMSGKEQDQLHHHHLHQQQPQQLHHQSQQQHEPIPPLKIKLPIGTLSSSDALLRTDSLSGTDPALSDGSVGSAPSLGLSPGPPCSAESTRSQDKNKQKSQMMSEGVDDEGLEERGDEKDSESKAGFVASFLDFLKTGKRPPSLDISPGMEPDNGETSPCKSGGLRPLSPAPPPPPPPPPFGDSEGNGGLALGNCPSPKRLEDELKRNLETLPSFSSDEEDSVGKNQDLQKSISSAISALYDTPQLTSNIQAPLPPPPPQPQPTQAPLTPTLQPPTLSPQPTMHTPHTQPQSNEPDILQPEDGDMDENKEEENEEERSMGGDEENDMIEEREPQLETLGAPKLDAVLPEIPTTPATPDPPSVPPSPACSSSPSHSPLPPLSLPSPLPPPEEQQENSQPPSPAAPSSPSTSPPPPAVLPQPATPPPPPPPPPTSPPPPTQKESPMPSPESPASPEEPPAPKITSLHLAQKQEDAAIVGESEEDESESGGEGIFRERDEFVVRVEDIRTLKLALQTGREPPPIWRVQKALLQKFSPEIKDGQRQFCATSNYLGYFGDAKRRYQRIYVKFLENVNKKDYVRVCSRRPWRRATPALRRQSLPRMASPPASQVPQRVVEKEERVAPPVQREQREKTRTATAATKDQREEKEVPAAMPKTKEKEREHEKEKRVQAQQDKMEKRAAPAERGRAKEERKVVERKEKPERPPKSKLAKVKAEPPPKKRKKWLKEVPSSSDSDSSDEAASENEMPVKGGVNNRAMREMFRSYVEMLVSTALDPDMIQALEDTDDELYLPPMRKIDSILSEQKRRLLRRVSMSSQHQEILHAYPQIIVDPLDSGVVRVRLSGDAYNRKTLNRVKRTLPKPQDLKLSAESYRLYSLYHSLHHYKYHTFLQCKKETNTIEQAAEDPGQEEVVQQCMANQSWLDTLFSSFIELLTLSTKA